MIRTRAGKAILTCVISVFAVINVLADWNKTHLFNPTWHPHARFHAAVMSLIVWCVSAIALWLLWRRSKEPELGVKVAALLALTLWTPFLYADRLVPGSSQLVDYPASAHVPQVAGIVLYPQVVLALMAVMLIAGGYGLARRGSGLRPLAVAHPRCVFTKGKFYNVGGMPVNKKARHVADVRCK